MDYIEDYGWLSMVSFAFLILLWCGFYWLAENSYVELVFLQFSSLTLILVGSILAYIGDMHGCSWSIHMTERERRIARALLIYAVIFIVVFIMGCFLLSGSPSFTEFAVDTPHS